MKGLVLLLALALTVPCQLSAQEKPNLEIGMRAGLSIVLPENGSIVTFGVPGGATSAIGALFGSASTVHLAFFPSEKLMIEPQLNFSVINVSNGASETLTTLGVTGQLAYLFKGASGSSPYAGFGASFLTISNGDSESDFAVGGQFGYRFVPVDHLSLRLEAGYHRWFDLKLNEINLALVLGVILK